MNICECASLLLLLLQPMPVPPSLPLD